MIWSAGSSWNGGGKTVERVLKLLQAAGYFARILLLNSAHYGCAQARERVFDAAGRRLHTGRTTCHVWVQVYRPMRAASMKPPCAR